MTANPLSPLNPTTPGPVTAGPQPPAAAPRFTPLDPIRVLRQYLKLLVAVAAVGFVVGVGAFLYLKRYSPEYSSTAQLQVTGGVTTWNEQSLQMGKSRLSGEQLSSLINNQIALIRSEDVLGEVLKRNDVRNTQWYNSFSDPGERMRKLREELSLGNPGGSNLLSMTMTGRYPGDLSVILDTLIDVYLSRYRQLNDQRSTNIVQVYSAERRRADDDSRRINEQLIKFKSDHQLPDVDNRSSDASVAYNELSLTRVRMQPVIEQAEENYRKLAEAQRKAEMVPSPEDMAAAQADPDVRSRTERLQSIKEERQVMMEKFGENHRTVKELDNTAAVLEQEKQGMIDRVLRERQAAQIDGAKRALDSLQAQATAIQTRLDEARKRVRDLGDLMNEYKRMQSLGDDAIKRRDDFDHRLSDMTVLNSRPDVQAVERLIPPTQAELTSPRFSGVVSGTTILFAGIALSLVFLKELLDQRVKSPADMQLIPRVELLGIIPDAIEDPLGPARIENVVQADPTGLIAESFRQVRSTILSQVDRRGYKTVMFVCAHGGSGTSTLVNNLALSMAYNGRKVLVIDANLRRPIQHKLFGAASSSPGLIEIIRGVATLDQAIIHKEDPRIDILPTGNAQDAPPEVVESPAFRQLVSQVEAQYDLILIDAPPALLTSESQLLSGHVDAAVVVVRAAVDKRGVVGRMLRQLEGQRADLLGVILNGVRSSAGGYFRKNYEEFYRYRGGPGSPGVKQIASKSVPAAAADESKET